MSYLWSTNRRWTTTNGVKLPAWHASLQVMNTRWWMDDTVKPLPQSGGGFMWRCCFVCLFVHLSPPRVSHINSTWWKTFHCEMSACSVVASINAPHSWQDVTECARRIVCNTVSYSVKCNSITVWHTDRQTDKQTDRHMYLQSVCLLLNNTSKRVTVQRHILMRCIRSCHDIRISLRTEWLSCLRTQSQCTCPRWKCHSTIRTTTPSTTHTQHTRNDKPTLILLQCRTHVLTASALQHSSPTSYASTTPDWHTDAYVLDFFSASLYFSKRGAYWDRLCRDVVGWLSCTCTVAKRCILGL